MKSFWCFTILVLSVATCCLPAFAGPSIIISEVMFNPKNVSDTLGEWIEMFNANNFEVIISGWQIKDKIGATKTYTFPENTKIEANGFLILKRIEWNNIQ